VYASSHFPRKPPFKGYTKQLPGGKLKHMRSPDDTPGRRALERAWRTFQTVPPGKENDSADFVDCTREDKDWLYPPVYDVHGEQLTLHGPIEIKEIARRRKMRFVAIMFYWPSEESKRLAHQFQVSGWAWQGENQILHLLTDHRLLARDPMNTSEIDTVHRRFLENDRGHREAWEADA
jgi:hypothetical protein